MPEDRDRADRILQALTAPAAAPVPVPQIRAADGVPRIQRRNPPESNFEERVIVHQRPAFSGKFVALECTEPAKIVLDTPQGKKVVMIDDPTRLIVNSTVGAKMDLTCGPQKGSNVRLEYDPADLPGIDGLARAIQFEK